MDGNWKTQGAAEAVLQRKAEASLSPVSRLRQWSAAYGALELIAGRDNEHLLRDAGLSRDEARDSLRPWRIIGSLLLPRSGRT